MPGVGVEEGVRAHGSRTQSTRLRSTSPIRHHEAVDPLQLVDHVVVPAPVCLEDQLAVGEAACRRRRSSSSRLYRSPSNSAARGPCRAISTGGATWPISVSREKPEPNVSSPLVAAETNPSGRSRPRAGTRAPTARQLPTSDSSRSFATSSPTPEGIYLVANVLFIDIELEQICCCAC